MVQKSSERRRVSDIPTLSNARPDEGARLVRTFLRIANPTRREAVIKFVEDMAKKDEADRMQ